MSPRILGARQMHTPGSGPWRMPVNTMRGSYLVLTFVLAGLFTGCATLEDRSTSGPNYSVINFARPNAYPASTMGKVFVEFEDGGEVMRTRVEEALRERGAVVVRAKDQSDTILRIGARYGLERRGYRPQSGTAGEFFAETQPVLVEDDGEYVGAEQNQLVMGALTGRIFLTDLFATVSQRTGAAAWFNKKLTGHPDGLCFGRGCNVVKTSVYVTLAIEREGQVVSDWRALVNGADDHPLVIEATGMALDGVLEPIIAGLGTSQKRIRSGDAR